MSANRRVGPEMPVKVEGGTDRGQEGDGGEMRGSLPVKSPVSDVENRGIAHRASLFQRMRKTFSSIQHPTTEADLEESMGHLDVGAIANLKMHAQQAKKNLLIGKRTKVKWVMPQDGRFRIGWDLLNVVMLMYTCFEIPFSAVFIESNCEYSWHAIVNVVIDLFFLTDVVMVFFTAYDDDFGKEITDHRSIARRYLRSWFFPDLISSIPVDRLACFAGALDESQSSMLRLLKIIRFLKMARLFKILRMFKKWETLSGSTSMSSLLRLGKFLSFMIFVTHVCGCLWMLVLQLNDCRIPKDYGSIDYNAECSCFEALTPGECMEWNWLVRYDQVLWEQKDAIAAKYLTSIYFTVVTLSTVGYGDVTPTNDAERAYAVMLALAGALVFAFCIGSISSLAQQGNVTEQLVEEEMHGLTDFLRFSSINRKLQHQLRLQLFYSTKKAPHLTHDVFRCIPRRLKNELVENLMSDTRRIRFFQGMDSDCRARILGLLKPCALESGDFVYECLDVGTEMYFIVRGEVEIIDIQGNVTDRKRAGDMIGEVGMFPENFKFRTCSARTRVLTELLELSREDLHKHIKPFLPDVYQTLKDHAMEQLKHVDMQKLKTAMAKRSAQRCRAIAEDSAVFRETKHHVRRARGAVQGVTKLITGMNRSRQNSAGSIDMDHLSNAAKHAAMPQTPSHRRSEDGLASDLMTPTGTVSVAKRTLMCHLSLPGASPPDPARDPHHSKDGGAPPIPVDREEAWRFEATKLSRLEKEVNDAVETVKRVEKATATALERLTTQLTFVTSMVQDMHCEAYTDGRQHARHLSMYRHTAPPGWTAAWLDQGPHRPKKGGAASGKGAWFMLQGKVGSTEPEHRESVSTLPVNHQGQFWVDPLNLDSDTALDAHSSEARTPTTGKHTPGPSLTPDGPGVQLSTSVLPSQPSEGDAAPASPPRGYSTVPELAFQQPPMPAVTPPRDVDAAHAHSNGGRYSAERGRVQAGHKLRPLPESLRTNKSPSQGVDE